MQSSNWMSEIAWSSRMNILVLRRDGRYSFSAVIIRRTEGYATMCEHIQSRKCLIAVRCLPCCLPSTDSVLAMLTGSPVHGGIVVVTSTCVSCVGPAPPFVDTGISYARMMDLRLRFLSTETETWMCIEDPGSREWSHLASPLFTHEHMTFCTLLV